MPIILSKKKKGSGKKYQFSHFLTYKNIPHRFLRKITFLPENHNSCSSVSIYGGSKDMYEERKEDNNVVISEKVSESNHILIIVLVTMSLHKKVFKHHLQIYVWVFEYKKNKKCENLEHKGYHGCHKTHFPKAMTFSVPKASMT
jgi:hypothetical protein